MLRKALTSLFCMHELADTYHWLMLLWLMGRESMPFLTPWENGQLCSLELLAMDGCGIIRIRIHNLLTTENTLFCYTTWITDNIHYLTCSKTILFVSQFLTLMVIYRKNILNMCSLIFIPQENMTRSNVFSRTPTSRVYNVWGEKFKLVGWKTLLLEQVKEGMARLV